MYSVTGFHLNKTVNVATKTRHRPWMVKPRCFQDLTDH